MHPGGVRSDTHLFYFEKSANLKHPSDDSGDNNKNNDDSLCTCMLVVIMVQTTIMTTKSHLSKLSISSAHNIHSLDDSDGDDN